MVQGLIGWLFFSLLALSIIFLTASVIYAPKKAIIKTIIIVEVVSFIIFIITFVFI